MKSIRRVQGCQAADTADAASVWPSN